MAPPYWKKSLSDGGATVFQCNRSLAGSLTPPCTLAHSCNVRHCDRSPGSSGCTATSSLNCFRDASKLASTHPTALTSPGRLQSTQTLAQQAHFRQYPLATAHHHHHHRRVPLFLLLKHSSQRTLIVCRQTSKTLKLSVSSCLCVLNTTARAAAACLLATVQSSVFQFFQHHHPSYLSFVSRRPVRRCVS